MNTITSTGDGMDDWINAHKHKPERNGEYKAMVIDLDTGGQWVAKVRYTDGVWQTRTYAHIVARWKEISDEQTAPV